jgi:PAS domain S-box-containing protein
MRVIPLSQLAENQQDNMNLAFQLLDQTLVSTCLFNFDGDLIKANPAFCRRFSLDKNALEKADYNLFKDSELKHSGVLDCISEVIDLKQARIWEMSGAAGLRELSGKAELIEDDAEVFEVVGFPLLNDEGNPIYIVLQYHIKSREEKSDKLTQQLHQFRESLVDNQSIWVNQLDNQGNVIFWNKAAELISGYSRDEVLGGTDIWEWSYPDEDYRRKVMETASMIIQGEEINGFETTIISKNGDKKTVSWYSRSLMDSRENIIGSIAFGLNVTDRKRAEEDLQKSEERYKSYYDNALVGLFSSKISDGTFLELNSKAAQLLGMPIEKIQRKVRSLDLYRDPEQRRKLVETLQREGEAHDFEVDMLLKNGKEVTFSLSVKAYPEDGYMEGAVIDITDNKRAERALRNSEEKYRNVVQNALEAICVVQDERFQYFNPQTMKLFGYSDEEMRQIHIDDTIYPDDREIVFLRRRQRAKGELAESIYSHRIITKDKRVRWVDIKPVTISWDEQPAILVFLTDVTERKRTEALMMQTEKIMSIGGLAAGMAHELNNPIGAMLMGTQNVLRRLSPDMKANLVAAEESGIDLLKLQKYLGRRKITAFLEGVQESGKKASQIILNMLQFSRKSESKKVPVDLLKLVENVLELVGKDFDLQKSYDFKSIKIIKEIDPQLPLVPCSETEIEQVFLNLFKNAAQAMKKGDGKDQEIHIRMSKEEKRVKIEIEDNGKGMENAIRKRIFEPFYTTKPTGKGTGLGLSVSYMIITSFHKGTMEVESEPNRGTRFVIGLPLNLESEE